MTVAQRSMGLGLRALNELSHLTANSRQHVKQIFVRLTDLTAKTFQYAQDTAVQLDRKPEGPMKTKGNGKPRSRKVRFLLHVSQPQRFTTSPHTPRQAGPSIE